MLAMGACAICGGPFHDSCSVVKGRTRSCRSICVPGCPPRPRALLDGVIKLHEKIRRENTRYLESLREQGRSSWRDEKKIARPASDETRIPFPRSAAAASTLWRGCRGDPRARR